MTRTILLMCGVAASVLYMVADVLGAMHFPGYSYTAQPTPWMGVFERINVFGFMLWNAVPAMRLLRGPKTVHAAATVPRAA